MFYDDHNPPHFHARYGRAKALVRIADGEIPAGALPPTARRLVREWALARRAELDILAQEGPVLEPLRSQAFFARVFIESGAPTWPNGYDIDPIKLYMDLQDAGALTRAAAE